MLNVEGGDCDDRAGVCIIMVVCSEDVILIFHTTDTH